MNTCIALVRGINVGGKNSLPMKELIAVMEHVGTGKVSTYIQSGNAVFQSASGPPAGLSGQIAAEIKQRFGFEPHVQILELDSFENAIANNPYPDAVSEPGRLHLFFLSARPAAPDLNKLNRLKGPDERFHLDEQVFYLDAPAGIGRSKLASGVEKILGVPVTARNWKSVCCIRDLARDQGRPRKVL